MANQAASPALGGHGHHDDSHHEPSFLEEGEVHVGVTRRGSSGGRGVTSELIESLLSHEPSFAQKEDCDDPAHRCPHDHGRRVGLNPHCLTDMLTVVQERLFPKGLPKDASKARFLKCSGQGDLFSYECRLRGFHAVLEGIVNESVQNKQYGVMICDVMKDVVVDLHTAVYHEMVDFNTWGFLPIFFAFRPFRTGRTDIWGCEKII